MIILSISPVWLFLLLAAGTSCFSMIVFIVVLYIISGRKDNPKILHTSADNSNSEQQEMPNIVGRSQGVNRQLLPNNAQQRQTEKSAGNPVTFANEIPSEELDTVFGEEEDPDPDPEENGVDLEDEEVELQEYRIRSDDEFAAGVSFENLNRVPELLEKQELQTNEQKEIIHIATQLVETDLWNKITQAIPFANEKVARLLDASVQNVQLKNVWQSFDIRNFID